MQPQSTDAELPLAGVRVVEFTHMVMGPTCGMILGDLGAEVIKVEPLKGDNTRRLIGAGAGFFPLFNRNKKSLAVDTKDPRGREIVLKLVAAADVFSENFKGGTMEKLGFGYAALAKLNPRLDLRLAQGFPAGAVRAPHRARRSGADDGRPRLHHGAGGPAAARRLVGQRHHGRHVRRDRRARGAARARTDRPRAGGAERAVREQRVPGRAAHDAVRRHRQAGGADAGPDLRLGHLRRLHRQGWRADLPGRGSPTRSGRSSATVSVSTTCRPIRG